MKPRADLTIEECDGELIVLDKDGGEVHQLNQTAALIWSKLNDGLAIDEIAALITETFDVEREIALADIRTVVDQFQALGLFEV